MPLLKIAFCNRYPNCSRGHKNLLARVEGIDELYPTCGSKELLEKLKEHTDMHYVFLDDELEEVSIVVFIELLCTLYPKIKIVVLTPSKDITYLRTLHAAGGCGIIHKSFEGRELRFAIDHLEKNSCYTCPVLLPIFMNDTGELINRKDPLSKLNFKKRQLKILARLQAKKKYVEIADEFKVGYDYIRKEAGKIKRVLKANEMLHILE